jgi:hypothetical protein
MAMQFAPVRSVLTARPDLVIREAVGWPRDQACRHYAESEFARKYGGSV